MSICNLRGFALKLSRQSFILAHNNSRNVHLLRTSPAAAPPLRSIFNQCAASGKPLKFLVWRLDQSITFARCIHNQHLFQTVKRQSMEARKKENETNRHLPLESAITSSFISRQSKPHQYSYSQSSSGTSKSNVCENTEVLRAPSRESTSTDRGDKCKPQKPACQYERKDTSRCNTGGAGSGQGGSGKPCGTGGSSGGDKKGPCEEKSSNKKWLWALAALGGAGLLIWLLPKFMGVEKKSFKKECPPDVRKTIPENPEDLPKHVTYLLIGGGTAAFSAFRAIKSNDARAKILMITDEYRKPYMRPPLSKELWYSAKDTPLGPDYRFKQWSGTERSLFFEPEEFFLAPEKLCESAKGGIAVAHGFKAKKIDPEKHIVTLNNGTEIEYEKCLIATGCTPKNLTVFMDAPQAVKEKVIVYRTPDDFDRLKAFADQKKSIAIIGNGFTGSELACSLANYSEKKGSKIYQVFPETGNMSRVLPDYLSKWTTKKIEGQGVCVIPNAGVRSVQRDETMLKLELSNGETLLSDVVVVCVGCEPNTCIANVSGLEVDRERGGFVVNAELEARSDVFVAGDASCFYDPLLGRRRVEHHDHAVVSGRLAGENMARDKKSPYTHQSMFWSDLGPGIGYEAIGLVDSSLPTIGVFALADQVDRSKSSNHLNNDGKQSPAPEATSTNNTSDSNKTKPETVSNDAKTDPKNIHCESDDENSEHYGKGVIFYMRDKKIAGILLWNLFNRTGLARTIINQDKKYDDLNEVAKLFEIHS